MTNMTKRRTLKLIQLLMLRSQFPRISRSEIFANSHHRIENMVYKMKNGISWFILSEEILEILDRSSETPGIFYVLLSITLFQSEQV